MGMADTATEASWPRSDEPAEHSTGQGEHPSGLAERLRHIARSLRHDLRAPVTTIDYCAHRIRENEAELKPDSQACIDAIQRATDHLLGLADTLAKQVDPTRSAPDQSSGRAAADTDAALKMALENLATVIMRRDPRILFDELPDVGAPMPLVTEIFQNLIANAIEHGPDDTWIQVRATVRDGRVHFEVLDNGPGMDTERIQRTFRLDEDEPWPTEGHGLGLLICRHIVAGLGGRIDAEARRGVGTCIRFDLPVALEQRAGTEATPAAPTP